MLGCSFSFVFYKLDPTLERYFFGLGSFHLALLPVVCTYGSSPHPSEPRALSCERIVGAGTRPMALQSLRSLDARLPLMAQTAVSAASREPGHRLPWSRSPRRLCLAAADTKDRRRCVCRLSSPRPGAGGIVLIASKRFNAAPSPEERAKDDPTRPLLSGKVGINDSPDDHLEAPAEEEKQESFVAFTVAMAKSLGFWLVCLALFLQIGVGGTYATNLGAVIVAAGGSDNEMGSDVALAAVVLNAAQLFGRVCLAVWSSPKFRCGLSSDQQTLIVLAFVGVTYAITFGLAAYDLSLTGVYAITVFFGIGTP